MTSIYLFSLFKNPFNLGAAVRMGYMCTAVRLGDIMIRVLQCAWGFNYLCVYVCAAVSGDIMVRKTTLDILFTLVFDLVLFVNIPLTYILV